MIFLKADYSTALASGEILRSSAVKVFAIINSVQGWPGWLCGRASHFCSLILAARCFHGRGPGGVKRLYLPLPSALM